MTVAKEGELAEPRVPAPAALRPVLGFTRFSAAAYGTIARALDEDGTFRARVAEAADEADIGRASWLYLHRPVGWLDDPALQEEPTAPAASARSDEKAATARLRKAAADADAARRRTADQLAEVRRAEASVRAERDRLVARIGRLEDERNAAVRRSKEVEAQLATTRRDLKLARQAAMDAEAELLALRAEPVVPEPASLPPTVEPVAPFDRTGVTAAVAAASSAAAELAAALADAAQALGTTGPEAGPTQAPAPPLPPATKAKKAKGGKGKRPRRVVPTLPPGTFDGTVEAHRALIADGANLLVVDGYNLARAAWSGLAPEEERRRTVALLDEVQARSGGRVVVVFDGDDAVTAPKASKNVRVRFSATGQTADEAIVDLLAGTPAATPVVVVSSDKAVARDAERQGAVAVGSRPFLRAAGR